MQSHAHNQLKHNIQQPLFKLTTSSASHSPLTSSSYFASPIKSVSHGHQLNIRPVNSPSSNYFRPNTPRQKERGDQIQFFQYTARNEIFKLTFILLETEKVEKERAQSAERIQTLHTRLHQEAEKIRKWKTSTEIEIKEKVRIPSLDVSSKNNSIIISLIPSVLIPRSFIYQVLCSYGGLLGS